MLDQVIDIILQVDNLNLNTEILQSKFTFKIFSNIRNKVAKSQKHVSDSVEIPQFQDAIDTDEFEMSVLKHIHNLQLGDFNNVFKAKRCLVGEPILLANFNKDHLLTVLQNFKHESKENILLLLITLKKFDVYSRWI